ncbi:MAG: VanZ family protein [Deltaproteobacteria bacterium]|nr:VanZ family protein [Deltaproteobacteria bacterium]
MAFVRWMPAIIYAAIIVALSSSSRPLPIELPFSGCDKLLHVAEYALLALLVRWPLSRMAPPVARHADAITAALVGLFGLSDELHQSLVPGREADSLDVLADCVGALFGIALWRGFLAGDRKARVVSAGRVRRGEP